MKKQNQYLLIISLLSLCAGCGKQDHNAVLQPEEPTSHFQTVESLSDGNTELDPSASEPVAPTSPIMSSDTHSPVEQTNVFTTTDLYEQSAEWDNVDDEIIPDLGDTEDILQFTNDDMLFLTPGETLPLYAIDIRRDSTFQYLLQVGMEDVTVLEYIDDSLVKTADNVGLQYHMPAHPEYDLYMEYSIDGAYWNFALIVK
ncbi:MAG: hypothetical protein HDR21_05560 [Lachnospiraceae bacterium]|nr:hypothetical protein [Lachnospiraceae bacterium]